MDKSKDVELHSLLSEAATRERHALKRATLYTIIPVFIGLVLVCFSAYQVIKLTQSKEELRKEIGDLQNQKEKASAELKELQDRVQAAEQSSAKKSEALAKVEPVLKQASEGKVLSKEQVQISLRDVQKASGSRWIVVSGDAALDAAQYEVKKIASELGYTKVEIYLRQNSYRTVIEFPDEATAQANLTKIQSRYKGAYLRDLAEWCPKPQKRGDYYECSN